MPTTTSSSHPKSTTYQAYATRKESIEALNTLHQRHNQNSLLISNVHPSCLDERHGVVLGIDEAGRGPVLGPMTYVAAYWSLEFDEELEGHGFKDSKQMAKEHRKSLFDKMIQVEKLGFILRVLHASEISANMLRNPSPYNLNSMSHDAAMELITAALENGVEVCKVYVDTVGNPDSYRRKLESKFNGKGIEFVVEKKADDKYASCSAASIVAKVMRDELTGNWIFSEGKYYVPEVTDYGSGYPSDPKCKVWMEKNLVDP